MAVAASLVTSPPTKQVLGAAGAIGERRSDRHRRPYGDRDAGHVRLARQRLEAAGTDREQHVRVGTGMFVGDAQPGAAAVTPTVDHRDDAGHQLVVVLDDRRALQLSRAELPEYWQGLLSRSRLDAPVIRTEMFLAGRVVRAQTLDYRSPVFGVASLAYSRAVNGIAATWLAGWRNVRGDTGQTREPRVVAPHDAPPAP